MAIITESELQDLAEIRDDILPGHMFSEKRRTQLTNRGLIYRDDGPPWKWHLTKAGLEALRAATKERS